MKLSGQRGVSLIIVIMVMAFLFSVGFLLLSITGTGPQVAGNVRFYQEAFNAAEAGFDSSWSLLNELFMVGDWLSFAGHYLEGPKDLNDPGPINNPNLNWYRRLTDEEILSELSQKIGNNPAYRNILFFNHPWIPEGEARENIDYRYTCFLINDEAGGNEDPKDARLVCIGIARAGNKILATARIEVLIAYQGQ